jgi:acyl-CoA synthetase (AMP-forming)/AMP-acid ligase II
MRNCPEMILAYFACFKAGIVAVPLNNRYKGAEVEYAVNHCGARMLIAQDALLPEVLAARARLDTVEKVIVCGTPAREQGAESFDRLIEESLPADLDAPREEDAAVILYTSGTTARPKGVVHTYGTLSNAVVNQTAFRKMAPSEISLASLSICHVAGLTGQLLATVAAQGTIVLLPRFDAGMFLDTIGSARPTTVQLLPEQAIELIEHPAARQTDFSSLRCCVVGGDRVPMEEHRRFRQVTGCPIVETCGSTESFSYAMNPPEGPIKPGSIGTPVCNTVLRLVDDSGRDVPIGEMGEILVKSRANTVGYWNDPGETAKTLKDGWYYSGDLARADADGYYWFAGRKKHIIIRGGSNISPREVEEVLFLHPDVKSACVVGKPDPVWGQRVKAYVSCKAGTPPPTADALRAFAAARIAAYKTPEEIEFLPDLPLNAVGKVDRKLLAERAASEG